MTAARLLFAGTPDFALASLESLVEAGHLPVAVLTQPDRPSGRGRKLKPGPVKQFCVERDIPVMQPVTLKDPHIVEEIASLRPDIMIVAAYGLILPGAVLDVPRLGCVNVHASLLPRWRGAAPIQQAILNGDAETGICLMQMDPGLDTGPVYARAAIDIGPEETAGALHDRLAKLGASLLVEKLPAILAGELTPVDQDEADATYAGKIRKEDAKIDWSLPAATLHRKIRAYDPAPGAWFELAGDRIKCWGAEVLDGPVGPAGVVLRSGSDGIDVACGDGALRLTVLQRPGRRRVSAAEFAAQTDYAGKRLG
jgi:methionyl-tRNA formyltransferase